MHPAKILLYILSILVIYVSIQWHGNQPQQVGADVPAGKLMSLSFAPYHEGFSPIEQKFPLAEHIDEDLAVLADKTENIRTYSILGGMEPTPAFAKKYGVNVIQGGWLGNGPDGNQKEIDALIKSVNANPDVVRRIIVGNEVLLRKDMDVDTLIGYIRQVKRSVTQPVSYADVWSIYLKYPQLMQEVDFITIHILPYWEDEPVSIDNAAEHVEKIVKQIEDKMVSMGLQKPILIGESGWPAQGRQRGMAIPSVVNEAKFIRSLIQIASRHGYDYNIVEAFNQPWKSHNEGVVGANWGLLSIDREPVFPLTGTVIENPNWKIHVAISVIFWLFVISLYLNVIREISSIHAIVFLVLSLLMVVSLTSMAIILWQTSYTPWQRLYTLFIVIANLSIGRLLIQRFCSILRDVEWKPLHAYWLTVIYVCFTVFAIYKSFILAFNGRYLSFPSEQLALPVIGICGLIICHLLRKRLSVYESLSFGSLFGTQLPNKYYRTLTYFMLLGIPGVVIGEIKEYMTAYDFIQAHPGFFDGLPIASSYTFYNQQLLSWLLSVFILSVPFWPKHNSANNDDKQFEVLNYTDKL